MHTHTQTYTHSPLFSLHMCYVCSRTPRVGIAGMTAPARGHSEIFSSDGKTKIGEVTSGGFGPTYKKPLAIGYLLGYVYNIVCNI